jgi:hypothetical protein
MFNDKYMFGDGRFYFINNPVCQSRLLEVGEIKTATELTTMVS